jgi:tetratricopeptide (TPR) repeat protein
MKLYRILLLTLCAFALIACGGAEDRKAVYMEKAKSSIETGDLDKARIELKNVLQIDPKDAEAYYQLGKVFEQQKEYRKAFGNYLKAEELNPDLLENQARLGRIYLLLANQPEKAQEKIDFILSKEADNSDGLLLKAAMVLRKDKNIDEAIKIAKDIVARDSTHIESTAFLATLYMKEKKNKETIELLDTALKNNPNNENLNKLLALALVVNKDYQRAEVIYKDFLERNPDNSSSYNNLAAFYNQTGDKVKAEETLRASVDNDSADEDRILILIKYIRETKGNDEAIKELKSFIASNNGLGKLRTALAELYILKGDKPSAVTVFKQAINDFSEEVTGITARTSLAAIYISDKDYDKASEVVEDAASISPNDPQVNFLRAKFAVRDKDLEKAIIALRIVTKEMPENIEAFILLASVYQQEGNEEQVKSTLNSAYENNTTNADALLKLAQYQLTRDINQAEKIIDNHNNIKPTDYDGLSIKAAILNQNKKQSEAYEIAKTLMETYADKPNGYLQAIPYYGQQKDKKGAVSLLEKGYLSVKDNRKLLLLLTTFQVEEKKFDIVENRIKAEIASAPDDAELKILLAKVYMINKNTDSAESLLNEALAMNPGLEEPYILLSQIYQNNKDLNAVKAILVKGKTNVKASLKIPLRLAATYEQEESYKKAIDIYREIHETHPDNLVITNNLASMLSDYGNGKDDLQLAKTLAEKLGDNEQPVFLDTIGWVYYKLGDSAKAIQYLTQVIEKMPEVNVFNYHLGMAYKLSGDKTQAKTYLEKSLADDSKPFKQKELAEAALNDL